MLFGGLHATSSLDTNLSPQQRTRRRGARMIASSNADRLVDAVQQARMLRAQGRTEQAIARLRAAISVKPDHSEAHHQLGNILKSLGRHAEAVTSLQIAAGLEPDNPSIWLNLGVACLELRQLDDAVSCFRRALRLDPGRPEALNILGHTLLAQGQSSESIACLREALRLRPGYAAAHDNLGRALKAQGRVSQAITHHRAALAYQPRATTHSNLLYSLNFDSDADPSAVVEEHRAWEGLWGSPASGHNFEARDMNPGRRLRIGYVSPDMVGHAVSFFLAPALQNRNRDRFEVFCYSNAPVTDRVTERLRGLADHWRDIARMEDGPVETMIRADRIDILIDLAGHTALNRLGVFARRPAPIQITWLGYPNTTGLSTMDYRITESVSDPVGETESLYTEELLRLPEAFACYAPPRESPEVGPLPGGVSGPVTFGSFNNIAKVTPAVLKLWGQVLASIPSSRIFLKSRGLGDRPTADRIRSEFSRAGVEESRIRLDGGDRGVADHLRLYHSVDIALDPFPYNGTTTTCEALWMGVPVVTLAGTTHAARVGASLLTHLGTPEWIASDPAGYAMICSRLASDRGALTLERARLRERMRRSPLCDGPRWTSHFENALRAVWARRCDCAVPARVCA